MASGPLRAFEMMEVTPSLIERETGKKTTEELPFMEALRSWFLYQTPIGRTLLALPPTWWIIGWQHRRLAAYANSPQSKKSIPGLIKSYKIPTESAEKPVEEYGTLQEFFARRIKPELRPIAAKDDGTVAVMPADSRCVVYDSVGAAERFWIKGRSFNVARLLGLKHGERSPDWEDCAIAINRLSPCDHHRLHASVRGNVVRIRQHGNRFMGSGWAATHSSVNVMTENERLVMEIDSPEFGPVVQVMIGASEVGSCRPLVPEGHHVSKGDEVAVFAYGGSIMATLFRRGAIAFDQDLLTNTARGSETRVNYGSSLGRATRMAPAGGGEGGRGEELGGKDGPMD